MPNKFDMFFEEITKWVDDGYPVYVIYFDFQKAFGKSSTSNTNTRIKITCYGKQHNQLDSTMLNDRRQMLVVVGEFSNWKSVLSGVPQGYEL